MRPRDYEPGGDSGAWEAEYEAWMAQGRALAEQQQAWRDALDRELSAVATLEVDVADAIAHRDALAAFDAHIVELEARITQASGAAAALDAPIASIRAEREAATAQLLGNIASGSPVVLLPVRVETRWIGPELWVRIFPDELEIDSHEPALTEDERVWAEHYWQAGEPLRLPAWRQLAGRFGVTRAAWIVAATDPQGSTERRSREGSWTRPPHAVALPDRWAVLGLVGEEPVVTAWSAPVATPLPAGPSPDHGVGADAGNQWLVDFEAAEAAGMAVRLTADPERVPRPLDALLVVGVRSADGDLAALLDAHHYTRGLRLVPSGTPTNNTHAARAGRARPDPDHAYAVERGPATDAGVSAARTLGVEPSVLEHVEAPALDDVHARAMQRVLAAAGGELRERLVAKAGPDAVAALWAHVRPAGQLPALLVGAQPYGILAATALDRWAASDGDATAAAGVALATAWPERRTLTAARTAWTDSLVDVITEHAASSHFGADGAELPTVGPAGPDGRLADPYLERIADAAPGAPVAVPPVLLARLAAAAMRAASGTDRQALADLLRQLATLPRRALARPPRERSRRALAPLRRLGHRTRAPTARRARGRPAGARRLRVRPRPAATRAAAADAGLRPCALARPGGDGGRAAERLRRVVEQRHAGRSAGARPAFGPGAQGTLAARRRAPPAAARRAARLPVRAPAERRRARALHRGVPQARPLPRHRRAGDAAHGA